MKTIMTTPVIDISAEAPEWAVAAGYTVNGNPENPDRICVWQNGALVVDAVNDIPTYDALSVLTNKANQLTALTARNKELVKRVDELEAALYTADDDICFSRGLLEDGQRDDANNSLNDAINRIRIAVAKEERP